MEPTSNPNLLTEKDKVWLVIDCEFTNEGLVREVAIVVFKNTEIYKCIEINISDEGADTYYFNAKQLNYHLKSAKPIPMLIDRFIKYAMRHKDFKEIILVGMNLNGDLIGLRKTLGKKTLLDSFRKISDINLSGSGTLSTKAENNGIDLSQVQTLFNEILGEYGVFYTYHTALFDAVITGYIYFKLNSGNLLTIHPGLKNTNYKHYDSLRQEIRPSSVKNVVPRKTRSLPSIVDTSIPKGFPKTKYAPRTYLSQVMDIVSRELLNAKLCTFSNEPTVSMVKKLTEEISTKVTPTRRLLIPYDTETKETNPYDIRLVHAGILLVEEKITLEDFIDFAIYMQQYSLPKHLGTYFKVISHKNNKELYIRALKESTAKKFINKQAYCTIEQFLNKKADKAYVEILD